MDYLALCVEQLDLSVKQLHFNVPSYDRLSLILADNIIELMLHKQCKRLIMRDDMWKPMKKGKYPETTRKVVLGRDFTEKTKFCKKENLISEEERLFINICHKHRNVLYHVGIKYNDLLHSLAILYHKLGCDLFKRLKPDGYMLPFPRKKYSEAVEKHINPSKRGFDLSQAIDDACESLSKDRPNMPIPFPHVMSNSALKGLENIENGLAYLVENNPDNMNEKQIVFHVQLWEYMADKNAIDEATKLSGIKFNNFFRAMKYMQQNWKAPIQRNPIQKWKIRADNLKRETNNYVCLAKYDTLRTHMSEFEEAVDKAWLALETQIQLDIDVALGK